MTHGGKRLGSGRPQGSKSEKTLEREALRQFIFEKVKQNQEKIVKALIEKGTKGDVAAIRELLDRAVGKVKDEVEMSSNEKEPITFVIRSYANPIGAPKIITQTDTSKV